jgi:hypothetical protein
MSAALSIRKVETRADFETFVRFPWSVYKGDPYWVPPLLSAQRHKLDKTKGAAWEYMEGDYFIAWRGEKPVGTIAAFINHRHNDYWDEHIGFFGCFEVNDDQEAAAALLETAADYVQTRGYTAIRGPATFSTNAECGILIEGFDDPPVLMYPYNPPYYQRLVENVPGFQKVMDLYGYYLTLEDVEKTPTLDQIFRVIQKNGERRRIAVRTVDASRLSEEFTLLKDIYNKAWEKNWGFVPFSPRELDEMVAELGRFFNPRMAFFAEIDGRPIAFLLGLPDMNQVLRLAYPRPGRPEIVSLLQLLWHWKVRRQISRVRIMLMGIEDGYRKIGVDAAMFVRAYQTGVDMGWHYADGGWVLETNEPMNRLAQSMNGRIYKRFRFYERALSKQERLQP